MITAIPLKNSDSLLILDRSQWVEQLSSIEASPGVVLLSSWEQQDTSGFQQIKPLVIKLIDLGCKYFVCAGKYSESLHDFIDDVVLDMPLSSQNQNSSDVMTTWHDTDTDDEVADFFLHSTNASNRPLVAILDEGNPKDRRLKKAVLSLAKVVGDDDASRNSN